MIENSRISRISKASAAAEIRAMAITGGAASTAVRACLPLIGMAC
jgi:hypothetical protein